MATGQDSPAPDPTAQESVAREPLRPGQSRGPLRQFLKILVEADSSRFALSRVKAMLLLLALLAAFGAIGYGLPQLISRYF